MTGETPLKRRHSSRPSDSGVQPDQQPRTLDACRRCPLWRDATQGVPGEGPSRAKIMLIGEQPGDAEDLQGKPFVGPAGALLDKAFEEAGLARNKVYVTNAVKHFKWTPRGKRRMHKTPAQREVDACGYWLEKEINAVGATVIVSLGATALKAVTGDSRLRLSDVLDKPFELGERFVVATYHPSFALRAPDPATRQGAYAAIVAALEVADRAAGSRGRK